jgi:hypothetical protein
MRLVGAGDLFVASVTHEELVFLPITEESVYASALPAVGESAVPEAKAMSAPALEIPHSDAAVTDCTPDQVKRQLDRLLSSSYFKNSKRHRRFLQFVVEKYLLGETSEIKERIIGMEVFDREPGYDVATDPIVRGAAAELRKRLALYYADPTHVEELRLEVPSGSYIPQFRWPEREVTHPPSGTTGSVKEITGSELHDESPLEKSQRRELSSSIIRRKRRWISLLVVGTVLMGALGFASIYFSTTRVQKRNLNAFWKPLMGDGNGLLICAGSLNAMMAEPLVENDTWNHVTKTRNHLDPNIGIALVNLSTLMGEKGQKLSLKLADTTSLAELRSQPTIFLGGFNNPWTQRIQSGMRFQLKSLSPDVSGITDQTKQNAALWTFDFSAQVRNITHSYALITRINDPLTGQNIVSLAGLGSYGNSSASEFVVSPVYFSQFLVNAPKNWKDRSLQIVIETAVVDGKPSPPKVVASQVY